VELSRIFCLTKYTKSIVLFQKKSFFLKESSENDAVIAFSNTNHFAEDFRA
jgi:hypothetical protein